MPYTAKQEAIRKAYGEYWEQVKDELHQGMYICLIDERSSIISWNGILMTVHDFNNHLYMPKSLQGIENNRGWIRIESEEDLPKLQGYDFDTKYWTIVDGEMRDDIRYNVVYKQWQKINGCRVTEMNVSHYQPIVKPEKPIY